MSELRQLSRFNRKVLNTIRSGVITTNAEGQIIHANECATDICKRLIDIDRSAVVGLVGSSDPHDPRDGQVNGATAPRSAGSTLKPFIFAAAFIAS